jgi:hypothetical protein
MEGKQKCTRETDRTKQGINQKAIIPCSFLFIMKESWGRCIHVCAQVQITSLKMSIASFIIIIIIPPA